VRRRRIIVSLAVISLCLVTGGAVWAQKLGGMVAVLYAGSLGAVVDKGLTPAVERTTGYGVQGEGHGSVAAARGHQVVVHEKEGDFGGHVRLQSLLAS